MARSNVDARFAVTLHAPGDFAVGGAFDGARIVSVDPALHALAVVTSDPGFQASAARDPRVVAVEPAPLRAMLDDAFLPNDPNFPAQSQLALVRAPQAWTAVGTGNASSAAVCFVDSGVRYTHEDLAGARWLGGHDFVNHDDDPMDDAGHGTHVAGIAAATIDNGIGIAGVGNVSLYGVKVLNANGAGYDDVVAQGISWCTTHTMPHTIISLSLGESGAPSTILKTAIANALDAGKLVVAAAGNGMCNDCVSAPASIDGVIAVSCTLADDRACPFSSKGPQVAIAAPGSSVYSLWNGADGDYRIASGTSMSTPFVSGALALAWSTHPGLTSTELRARLLATARDVGARGHDDATGAGILDVGCLVGEGNACATPPPAPECGAVVDAFGYTCASVPFGLRALTNATSVALSNDATSLAIPIPFAFDYYGVPHDRVWLSANGFLAFEPPTSGCCAGQELPDANQPNDLVAGVWTHLDPTHVGAVRTAVLGSAPTREFVAEWNGVPLDASSSLVTFQIVLHEGNDTIEVHVKDAPADGNTRVTGIEGPYGASGLRALYGRAAIHERAVAFTPPSMLRLTGMGGDGAPSVNLSWSAPAGFSGVIAGYHLYRSVAPHGWAESRIATLAADAASYQDAAVSPHVRYQYRLVAYSILGDHPTEGTSSNATVISSGDARPCEIAADVAGYVCGLVPFSYVDLGPDATPLFLGDDVVTHELPLSFNFTFYGHTYDKVYVGSNGGVGFDRNTLSTAYISQPIPGESTNRNFIAPMWDDHYAPAGGAMFVARQGMAPHRTFLVEWRDVVRFSSGPTSTFELILHEGSNDIEVQAASVPDDGYHNRVVGIEDPTGAIGVRYAFGHQTYSDLGILFTPPTATPPGAPQALSRDGGSLSWDAPALPPGAPALLRYRVYKDTSCAPGTLLGETTGTSFNDGSYDPALLATYRVVAVNARGEGAAATLAIATDARQPPCVVLHPDPLRPGGREGAYVGPVHITLEPVAGSSGVNLSTLRYSLDGGADVSGSNVTIGEGTHTLVGRVDDINALVGQSPLLAVQVDTTPPAVHLYGSQCFCNDGAVSSKSVPDGEAPPIHESASSPYGLSLIFSEPMSEETSGAALSGLDGWHLVWQGDQFLQLVRLDGALNAVPVVLGTIASDAHGVRLPAAFAFTINGQAVATTLTTDSHAGASGWFVHPPIVTLNATPTNARITYHIDGADDTIYDAPFAMPVGAHTLTYNATAPGVTDESPHEVAFLVDDAPPAIGALAIDPATPHVGDAVHLSLSVSDPLSGVSQVHFLVDGDPVPTIFDPVTGIARGTWVGSLLGPHTVAVSSTDVAGNSQHSDVGTFEVTSPDPPNTALGVPAPDGEHGWYRTPPSANLSATPEGSTIHVALDSAPESDYAGAIAIPGGVHTLHYRATLDRHPNESGHATTFYVDAFAPAVGALTSNPAAPRVGDEIQLSVPVSDQGSGLGDVTFSAGDTTLETTVVDGLAHATALASKAGSLPISIAVKDIAGNAAGGKLGSIDVSPRPPPVTTLTAPGATGRDGWHLAQPSVALEVEPANATIHYAFDDGAEANYASPIVIPLGAHALHYRATADGYENETPHTATFHVDDAAPTLGALTLDPASPQARSPVTIRVPVSDAISGVSTVVLAVNGAPLATTLADGIASATFTPQTTDPLTFHATATDAAGNSRSADVGTTSVRPRPAPQTTLTVAEPDGHAGWYQTPPSIALSATPSDATITYTIDGGPEHAYSGSFTIMPGVHAVSYHATAPASESEPAHDATFHVDGAPPEVGNATAPGSIIVGHDATVSVPVSDAISGLENVTLSANGVDLATTLHDGVASATATPNQVGDLTFAIVARDVAGNVRSLPLATVNVQPIPPRFASAPGAPVATLVAGHVHLTWSPPGDPGAPGYSTYHLYRGADLLATVAPNGFDDVTAERGHTYTYSVAAVSSREGDRSGITTFAVPVPEPGASAAAVAPSDPDGAGGWYATSPVVTLSATPADAGVRYHLDNGTDADYAGPITIPPGHHELRWFAVRPGAQNETAHARAFDVDTASPVIDDLALSAPNATLGQSVTITVHAHDEGSGISSVVAHISDGSEVTLGSNGGAYSGALAPAFVGSYQVTVTAIDAAGHSTTSTPGSWTVDPVVVPEASALGGANGTGTNGTTGPTPTDVGGSNNPPTGDPLERSSVGGSGSSNAGGGSGTGTTTTTTSTPPPPPSPVVVVHQGDPTINLDAGARGNLSIEVQNAPHPDRVRFVAIASDGHATAIGSGPTATWDTTQQPDGYYTVEARETQPDGSNVTIASASVHVRNVFDTPLEAAATAVVGVGAAALGTAAATALTSSAASSASSAAASATSAVATSSGGSQGFNLIQYLKDLVTDAGSDALRDKTKNVASIERRRKIRSAVSLVVTVVLIAVLYSVAEASPITMANVLATLPIVGAAAVVLALQKYGSESAIAHLSGARVRFRIWVAGVLSVLASTLIFRSPFGYPGYVDNGEETTESEKRKAGHRALAILGITSAWGLVFLAAAHLGYYTFGTVGIAMALTTLATAAMPFGPLAGAEVWRWNKLASIGVAIAAMTMYVTYQMALLPEILYVAIGVAGALGYAATVLYYRSHRQPPHRVPVVDVDAERAAAKGDVGPESVEKPN